MYSTCCIQLNGKFCFCYSVKRIWTNLNIFGYGFRWYPCRMYFMFMQICIFVNWPDLGLLNNIHMISYEFNVLVDPWNIPSTPFTRPSCVHQVQPTYFSLPKPLNVFLMWNLHHFTFEMIEDMSILCTQYEYIPFTLKENQFVMFLLCFICVK
jgi:hypothetical protein